MGSIMSSNLLEYSPARARELKNNYDTVLERIRTAQLDRTGVRTADSPEVHLVTVTKFFPASDVAALYGAGVRLFGENRDQEAAPKATLVQGIGSPRDPVRWAFIGQLQTNKAKSVVKYAHQIQSVDRPSLANALNKAYNNQLIRYEQEQAPAPAAYGAGGLECLIQVSLAAEATAGQAASGARGGAAPERVLELAEQIESLEHLSCAGVMAVAPLGEDPNTAFERLWGISVRLRERFPHAQQISAGMSADLEEAVRWGSTCVRVGSDIMGLRNRH